MKFNIPEKVLKETTNCQNEFACLKYSNPEYLDDHKMCEPKYADGKNVLFLKTKESAVCPYRVSLAFSQVCTCPTHFEINKQYGLSPKSNGE
jgi:hypothetical protein